MPFYKCLLKSLADASGYDNSLCFRTVDRPSLETRNLNTRMRGIGTLQRNPSLTFRVVISRRSKNKMLLRDCALTLDLTSSGSAVKANRDVSARDGDSRAVYKSHRSECICEILVIRGSNALVYLTTD